MRMRVCYNTIGKFGDLKKMKIKLNLGGFSTICISIKVNKFLIERERERKN